MTWNFADRHRFGSYQEQRVARTLLTVDWTILLRGQGMMPPEIRAGIRHLGSPLAQEPEILAARGERLCWIDCKSHLSGPDQVEYAIERAVAEAHRELEADSKVPVFYVMGDGMRVTSPHIVLGLGKARSGSKRGSGTPYLLLGARWTWSFDAVFGQPNEQQQSAELVAA